jgi:hypothetical protein
VACELRLVRDQLFDDALNVASKHGQVRPVSHSCLRIKTMFDWATWAFPSVHPATAVEHRKVEAGLAGSAAMCTASGLHGVIAHVLVAPPELTVPTTA